METIDQDTATCSASTATELWDIAATIRSSGIATVDDWDLAVLVTSHLLARLQRYHIIKKGAK